MTPQERLKEIEHENIMSGGDRDLTFLISRVRALEAALVTIESHIGKTNLHDCCVTKTCQPIYEDGKKVAHCTFQHGVNRGFNQLGHIAREALIGSEE